MKAISILKAAAELRKKDTHTIGHHACSLGHLLRVLAVPNRRSSRSKLTGAPDLIPLAVPARWRHARSPARVVLFHTGDWTFI